MRAVSVRASNDDLHIGPLLREARQRQSLTISQVAEATGLTTGFLSRIERDITSPSVATLVAICEALALPVGQLFAAPETAVVRAADAPSLMLNRPGIQELLLTPRNQPRLQMIRSTIDPLGSGGDDLYTINAELEIAHVLSGSLEIEFASRTETLEAGDTMTFPARDPHTWRNPSSKRSTEMIWLMTPATWASTD